MDTGKLLLIGGLGLAAWWYFSQPATVAATLSTPAAAAPPAPSPAASPLAPSMSITTSGGNQGILDVGDSYTVVLAGQAANAPVSITAQQVGSTPQTVGLGTTDGNGNFTSTGSVTANHVGSWIENWFVGGAQIGSWSFQVYPTGTVTSGVSGYGRQPLNLQSLRGLGIAQRVVRPRIYVLRSW
jgi:hypothetical protein